MGAAAYNRGSRLISAQLDREAEERRVRRVQALYVIEDAPDEPFSLADFAACNPDLEHADRDAIERLGPGQAYTGGGGAWAQWTIARVS